MELSVVIPALDEEKWIVGAIESARAPGVEILVADGDSADATAALAAAAGARVVAAPRGRARQLAVGAQQSRGEAIVFLHADTRLPRGYDGAIRAALRDERVVGGAFRLRFDARTPALRLVEAGARLRHLLGLPYGDQALFARRAALERIGGVPQAPIMEDLDLVRALRRCGRLVRLPLEAVTSARRYGARGVLRTAGRNLLAAGAWLLGLERARIAAWYRR